ncbi:hypothetical protein P8C59_005836 [Phyllachora maydis]|uniref:Uncharacterized protein n=1 Tax=Phyllachora maydis TaxID=1825666 RepID=A0AAD9I592_9PEZI|nr:hypothetical protein P8C59_005836 [Phyllachora maydis]
MSPPPAKAWIEGFSLLGPSICIQAKYAARPGKSSRPSSSASSTCSGSTTDFNLGPDLIIMTSWTGAHPKHVAKYIEGYQQLYPNTPIMVIRTVIQDLAFRSTKEKMATLAPAVDFICPGSATATPGSLRPAYSNLLLHAFSEGGSNKAVCLAKAYLGTTGARIPVAAFVFDSTPGTPRFGNNLAAFRRSLPRNRAVRALGVPFGFVVLAITWVLFSLFVGYDNNAISKTRRALNDSRLWAIARAPRTYIFSEADDLIWWEDVEAHGVEAAKMHGVTSLLVRFKKSGHCNHVKENKLFYWNAVRKTWAARDVELGACFQALFIPTEPETFACGCTTASGVEVCHPADLCSFPTPCGESGDVFTTEFVHARKCPACKHDDDRKEAACAPPQLASSDPDSHSRQDPPAALAASPGKTARAMQQVMRLGANLATSRALRASRKAGADVFRLGGSVGQAAWGSMAFGWASGPGSPVDELADEKTRDLLLRTEMGVHWNMV